MNMNLIKKISFVLTITLTLLLFSYQNSTAVTVITEKPKVQLRYNNLLRMPRNIPQSLFYDSGITIPYPKDGVKGIYVTAEVAATEKFQSVLSVLDKTALNSIVLDVKDDYGNITLELLSDTWSIDQVTVPYIANTNNFMKQLEQHSVYPIARIVTFKDTAFARMRPDLAFRDLDGDIWKSDGGDSFMNPFLKENWERVAEIAISAAKAGFKDIQLDYVRFPEQFEDVEPFLSYSKGEYENYSIDSEARVAAITDFIAFMRDKLAPYGVRLSADIFGYAATTEQAAGIGQNVSKIAAHVDAISSMIYPSHWGTHYFGIDQPDLHPYETIMAYMSIENNLLAKLNPAPRSRPWLQDFTAAYLGTGNYQEYGPQQVSQQIKALRDSGVTEYLLWNPEAAYSEGVDY